MVDWVVSALPCFVEITLFGFICWVMARFRRFSEKALPPCLRRGLGVGKEPDHSDVCSVCSSCMVNSVSIVLSAVKCIKCCEVGKHAGDQPLIGSRDEG